MFSLLYLAMYFSRQVAGQELMDEVTDEMRTEEELKVQQEKAAAVSMQTQLG